MTRLGVGIVGLGWRWRKRYRPALHALRDQFAIRAICAARYDRAEREARRLRCRAAGVVELLERKDVQAMLLLDAAWHGLWPLEVACRFGKPVFCAVPLDADAQHAETVCRRVVEARLSVMPALWQRFAPASMRLQELLRTTLGPLRFLSCQQIGPRPGRLNSAWLDWCALLMNSVPSHVRKFDGESGTAEMFVDFGEGRAARLLRWAGSHARRAVWIRLVAEHGVALVDLPNRLRWTDASGLHAHKLSRQPPVEIAMLERFHHAVTTGQPIQPSLEDARRAFTWLRAEPNV
jgi:predicted dehydrogenase